MIRSDEERSTQAFGDVRGKATSQRDLNTGGRHLPGRLVRERGAEAVR